MGAKSSAGYSNHGFDQESAPVRSNNNKKPSMHAGSGQQSEDYSAEYSEAVSSRHDKVGSLPYQA